ncbi:cytidine deaminase, partial [Genlisea aurea]
ILVLDGEKNSGGPFTPLSAFLPNPFGPRDLLHDDTPLLLEPHDNRFSPVETHSPESLPNGDYCPAPETGDALLRKAALEAANDAHAPYTGCPSGAALMDTEGKVYKGSYVESAAYNPSFGPVQAALVAYVAAGGGSYERIVAAALVEKEGAKVRQEDTARILLNAVSPSCRLRSFTVPISKP